MARCSNIILGILNGLALIIGIGIIAWVLSILDHWETECMKLLLGPLWTIGIVISVFSFVGLIGACCRSNFYLWIYMCKFGNPGTGVKRLVADLLFCWKTLACCEELPSSRAGLPIHVELNYGFGRVSEGKDKTFYIDGCCRPPEDCGFEFKNTTFWKVPKTGVVKKDGDCMVWNNQPDILCFDCNRCKQIFVADLRKDAIHFVCA